MPGCEGLGVAYTHNLTVHKNGQPIAEHLCLLHGVGGQDDAAPSLGRLDHIPQISPGCRIKALCKNKEYTPQVVQEVAKSSLNSLQSGQVEAGTTILLDSGLLNEDNRLSVHPNCETGRGYLNTEADVLKLVLRFCGASTQDKKYTW